MINAKYMALYYLDHFIAIFMKANSNNINIYKEFFAKAYKALRLLIKIRKNAIKTLAQFLKIEIDII